MRPIILHSEYSDSLDLFFSDTIAFLRRSKVDVQTCVVNDYRLFDIKHNGGNKVKHFKALKRFANVISCSFKSAIRNSNAIHVYIVPIHILLAPFVFLFLRQRYIIVCQGQLEGEGYFVSFVYRLLLSFSVRFAVSSYSCNIFETYRWHLWPLYYLSRHLKPLPWYGLCLNKKKIIQYSELRKSYSIDLSKTIKFGYLGRINKAKGCKCLIDFFMLPQSSHYKLFMCGVVEPSFANILEYIPKSSNIKIEPPISSQVTHHWFSTIDIFITFSRGESIGSATLEALLSGKPVISMINSGACQVLRHQVDSYIIQRTDPLSIQEAITFVLENYESMSKSAYLLREVSFVYPNSLASSLLNLSLP